MRRWPLSVVVVYPEYHLLKDSLDVRANLASFTASQLHEHDVIARDSCADNSNVNCVRKNVFVALGW